jgi:hypothetical protein
MNPLTKMTGSNEEWLQNSRHSRRIILRSARGAFQRANAKRRNADIIPAKHILFVMPRMFAVEAAVSAAISAFWYSQSEIFFVLSLKKRVGSLREDLIFV